ncbi:hypothetical protein PM082_007146 [Marasmius tenuissimus]|nr:hypothetical protein PM082_007146 [Marasmius tenuissimus]
MSRPSDIEYPRRIVVDDTDPRVIYDSGAWNLDASTFSDFGVFGDPYNRTMSGTNSPKAGFTFHFEGDFIQIKGAKDNRNMSSQKTIESNSTFDSMDSLPKYTCQVDGFFVPAIGYRPLVYEITNNVLCEADRLSKGPHTLTMNITLDDPNAQIFWLDSIEYAYLEGTDLSKEVVKIDGSDSISCVYHNQTGSWHNDPGSNLFNGTGVTGASMSFKFNGSSVSVYTFNEGSETELGRASGRYYIDNSGDTTFDIPGSKTLPFNQNNRSDWLNQHLFTSNKVKGEQEHEMVITYTGVQSASNSAQWLLIDYFYVTGASSTVETQTSSKTPIGAIVGGAVGGTIVILGLLGLVWLFMRRRRQRRGGPRELYPVEGSGFASPVTVSAGNYGHLTSPSSPPPPLPPRESRSPPPVQYRYHSSHSTGANTLSYPIASGYETSTVGSDSRTSQNFSDMKNAQQEAVSVQARQHRDSGMRYTGNHGGPSQILEVPPTYTAS